MVQAKTKAATDLGSLDTIGACNKPAEIEIKHPATGLGTGIYISLLGKDSDAYRGRVRALADENLRREAGRGPRDLSLDKLEAKNIDALAAATVGWRTGDEPTLSLNGEKLEFTPANVRRIYMEILPVREQVSEAINDLELFMRG